MNPGMTEKALRIFPDIGIIKTYVPEEGAVGKDAAERADYSDDKTGGV